VGSMPQKMIGQIDTVYTNAENALHENDIGQPKPEAFVRNLSFRCCVLRK
jgi:hypothetical protein